MSEDSIASDSISCRTEANAPLLPPRKRLLAGFKQNGWPSPSSSSCALAAPDPPHAKETLAHASATKEDADQNSGDAADGIDAADGMSLQSLNDGSSLQSLNGAAESLDSQSKGQRKLKRQRAPSPPTMKKFAKKKKKSASPESDEHLLDGVVDDAKTSVFVDKVNLSVSSKITLEVKEHSVALVEGEVFVGEKEERFTTANGEASAGNAMNLKAGSNSGIVYKDEEEANCEDTHKRRNPDRKSKLDIKQVPKAVDTIKRRKMSKRQKKKKSKDTEHKKLEMQREKVARMPLPLADEELARQLHRAINSSPRIARCLSPKSERPLLASSQKRFSGS